MLRTRSDEQAISGLTGGMASAKREGEFLDAAWPEEAKRLRAWSALTSLALGASGASALLRGGGEALIGAALQGMAAVTVGAALLLLAGRPQRPVWSRAAAALAGAAAAAAAVAGGVLAASSAEARAASLALVALIGWATAGSSFGAAALTGILGAVGLLAGVVGDGEPTAGLAGVAVLLVGANAAGAILHQRAAAAARWRHLLETEAEILRLKAQEGMTERRALERTVRSLERQLREASRIDPLSGAYDRGHFLEMAAREMLRAKRYERPLGLLVIDFGEESGLPDLTRRYGSAAGDTALRTAAAVCQKVLRETDVVGRIDAARFAAALPEAGGESAVAAARRVGEALAATEIPFCGGARLSPCMGVTELAVGDGTVGDLIARAGTGAEGARGAGPGTVGAHWA